jgi:alpha-N-arabinofuranosidase
MPIRFISSAMMAPLAHVLVAMLATGFTASVSAGEVRLTICGPGPVVHDDLFGWFLERPSWDGETGPEGLADLRTGDLPPAVEAAVRDLAPTILRFPGGTDIDVQDWTDLVDALPGRPERIRPMQRGHRGALVGTRFGLHEYERLRRRLGARSVLVVNVLDALLGRRPVAEAAAHAAGLVAYARLPVGAPRPEGMPDWPAARAANGDPEPFALDAVQFGNEWFMPMYAKARSAPGAAEHYIATITAYADAIHAVVPGLPLIIDGDMGDPALTQAVLADARVRSSVRFAAFHTYAPGPIEVRGSPDPGPQAVAQALTSMPGAYAEDGSAAGLPQGAAIAAARAQGYAIASTEWNANGWQVANGPRLETPWDVSAALGVAAFLHGMVRQEVSLATQSMLVGQAWGLVAVKSRPGSREPPRLSPLAQVSALYRHRHGSQAMTSRLDGVAVRPRPFRLGWGGPTPAVADADVLVTRQATTAWIHLVNRSSEPVTLQIDWGSLAPRGPGTLRLLAASGAAVVPSEAPWPDPTSLVAPPMAVVNAEVPTAP